MTLPEYYEEANSYQMFSGQGVAVASTYKKFVGKSGRAWLMGIDENPDKLYCTDSRNWDVAGRGFGGSTLEMPLEDGSKFPLKGGWHANAEAFFEDTGIDIRENHVTFVVVGTGRATVNGRQRITGLLYMDEEPTKGEFQRYKPIAQKIATELGRPVIAFSRSFGGSVTGPEYPEGTGYGDWQFNNDTKEWSRREKVAR